MARLHLPSSSLVGLRHGGLALLLAGSLAAGCFGTVGDGMLEDGSAGSMGGGDGAGLGAGVAGSGAIDQGGGEPQPDGEGGEPAAGDGGGGAAAPGGGGAGGAPPPVDTFCQGSDVLLKERLSTGTVGGQVSGGQLTGDGWRTASVSDQLAWDLGQGVPSGSLELEVKGLHPEVPGCQWGVCYYVGIFEEPSGDKHGDYTGSAFVESRYHTNHQENFHDTFKIQTGTGAGDMSEPMVNPGSLGWQSDQWHSIRLEWGAGKGRLYLDGAHVLTSSYGARPSIPWRYLFLGTTNYKGLGWAPVGVTFRNLCVRTQ